LTAKFLSQKGSINEFFISHQKSFLQYNGFNLLTADLSDSENVELSWISNRVLVDGKIQHKKNIAPLKVQPGIYGLSNSMLDAPWPKVKSGVGYFAQALAMDNGNLNHPEHYLKFLNLSEIFPDYQLPSTGVSTDWERALSPIFIKTEHYGTRSSTLLRVRKDGNFQMIERRFNYIDEPETTVVKGQLKRSKKVGN
jgi:uncharacterized protein with NRDE domain